MKGFAVNRKLDILVVVVVAEAAGSVFLRQNLRARNQRQVRNLYPQPPKSWEALKCSRSLRFLGGGVQSWLKSHGNNRESK